MTWRERFLVWFLGSEHWRPGGRHPRIQWRGATTCSNPKPDNIMRIEPVEAPASLLEVLVALQRLTDAARTSGGIAGRDAELCAACDEAEAVIARVRLPIEPA